MRDFSVEFISIFWLNVFAQTALSGLLRIEPEKDEAGYEVGSLVCYAACLRDSMACSTVSTCLASISRYDLYFWSELKRSASLGTS